jgi:hypothetical protein
VASIIDIRSHPKYIGEVTFAFKLPDGTVVCGDTPTEIVQAMSDEKMSTPKSLRSYRKAVARRINSAFPDVVILTGTDTAFIKSLVKIGQLVDIKKGEARNA